MRACEQCLTVVPPSQGTDPLYEHNTALHCTALYGCTTPHQHQQVVEELSEPEEELFASDPQGVRV